jgi:polyisoprenoid-binding protein YceI
MNKRFAPLFSIGWILTAISWSCVSGVAAAQDLSLEFNPAETTISFEVHASLHTVHGTFKLKSGTVHFNPATGIASGLVVVDVTSANTHNEGRDHKMHREVLESAKYPDATFSPNRISGEFHPEGESTIQVSGVLRLHGSDHPATLTVPVQIHANVLTATTHIVIPYVAWGLKNPSTFILRVSDKLEMDVKTTGQLASGASAAGAPK